MEAETVNDIPENTELRKIRLIWKKVKDFGSRYRKNRAAVVGLFITSFFVLLAIFGEHVAPYDPWAIGQDSFMKPCAKYLFGTDDLGRDIYSGVLYGARVSIIVGLACAAIATAFGIIIGSIAGYSRGNVGNLLMRITDFFLVIPEFFLVLVLAALFGSSVVNIILVIAGLSWGPTARLVRSEFLSLREQEFVDAARSIGLKDFSIVFKEILPNALSPAIVTGTLLVARAMLTEAGLSFLGLGDPNVISWGTQLFNAQQILRQAWWAVCFPGMSIFFVVLGSNLVGDGINDVLNPKLKEK
jgi:peptide/nickel transport system permease protein